MHLILMAKGEISPTGSNREAPLKEPFFESSVVLCREALVLQTSTCQSWGPTSDQGFFGLSFLPCPLPVGFLLRLACCSGTSSDWILLFVKQFWSPLHYCGPPLQKGRSAWNHPCRTIAWLMCAPLDALVCWSLHTSAEQKSHKKVSMWRQKWVDYIWISFDCHSLSTENGDSPGLVVECQSAWTLPRCQLWLPLSTVWSGEGHAGCRVDPALSAMHHWVRYPYIWMQHLWLCGFCLVSVYWLMEKVPDRVSAIGACSWDVVFIQIFFDGFLLAFSQICVPLQSLLQSVPLNLGHEVIVRDCDVFLPWKSNLVSVTNVLYGIIEDWQSFFVIWRLSFWRTLIEVHSFNCPEELEKIFIWIVLSSPDMIEKCYACAVWRSDPLLCVPLRNGRCQCPAKQSVDSVWGASGSCCEMSGNRYCEYICSNQNSNPVVSFC